MNPFLTLVGKLFRDVRWSLLFSTAALFALGWLFVYVTSLNESSIRKLLAEPREVCALHGDLHHDNVLDFGPRGWLAIDPHALVGERDELGQRCSSRRMQPCGHGA